MKHFTTTIIIVLTLFSCVFSTNLSDDSFSVDDQEGCEDFCMKCLDSGQDEKSFCVSLSQHCCLAYGGTIHGVCGCRVAL
jgi:hypothetical protein